MYVKNLILRDQVQACIMAFLSFWVYKFIILILWCKTKISLAGAAVLSKNLLYRKWHVVRGFIRKSPKLKQRNTAKIPNNQPEKKEKRASYSMDEMLVEGCVPTVAGHCSDGAHSCLPSICLPDWIQGNFALQHLDFLAVSGFHRGWVHFWLPP